MTFGSQLGVGCNMAPSVLSQIAADFDATPLQGWISSGWLLSTCVAFIVAGRLSDIFGRRIIITSSNVLAIIGYAMCAVTSDYSVREVLKLPLTNQVFVGGVIIQGFAGGLAQTATAAACEIVPNKYRPVAIAFLELGIAPTGYLSGSTFAHLIVYVCSAFCSWRRRSSGSIPHGGGSTVSASSCARSPSSSAWPSTNLHPRSITLENQGCSY